MIKKIILIFLSLILAAFIAYLTAPKWLPEFIAKKVETTTGLKTRIGSIHFDHNQIMVNGLNLANFPGSILSSAMKIDSMQINSSLSSLLKKQVVIDQIQCQDIYVGVEFQSQSNQMSNWNQVLNHMDRSSKGGKDQESEREVLIKKLILKNSTIQVVYKTNPQKIQTYKIKTMELNNLSSRGGLPIDQITKVIIRQSIQEIFSPKNLGNLFKNLFPKNFNPLAPIFSSFDPVKKETE